MDFVQYKCPCCGAALVFSPKTQKLSMEEYEREEQSPNEQDLDWEYRKEEQGAKRTEDGLYICPSCGAEIEADENTVSTVCPYCNNVVVIQAASSGEFEPDVMIPFQVKGDEAMSLTGCLTARRVRI